MVCGHLVCIGFERTEVEGGHFRRGIGYLFIYSFMVFVMALSYSFQFDSSILDLSIEIKKSICVLCSPVPLPAVSWGKFLP